MPMDFPGMTHLEMAAKVWKFRPPYKNETESEYRECLHQHVKPKDVIEAYEIKFGVGWDQWTEAQNIQMIQGG